MFPQIMLYAVVLFLFVTTSFTKAEENDKRPAHSSLVVIANWLSTNFDLPRADDLPRIELVPPAQIHHLRDRGFQEAQRTNTVLASTLQASAGRDSQREIVAAYDDSTKTIYLPESWMADEPTDESVLVHEMVRHLQNSGGIKYACDGARAKPAYLAQQRWLETYGLKLEQEFRVNRSECVN